MEVWDFFKLRDYPSNKIEQQLFWDYQYHPDDLCDLWGVSSKELDMMFREPYNRFTARHIEDIASMIDMSRCEVLLEVCMPRYKDIKSPEELLKFIKMKNR